MEPKPATYHVFINHRGPDVKNSLASLIYYCLTKYHNLGVFLDKNEIRTGDTISDTILSAIQSASVNIAIFSQRYAESTWCLDELLWMLTSHHKLHRKVIPVFYDVEPTDLRHIHSGCYKNAFEDHQGKGVSNEVIEKWRNALYEASNLAGIVFKTEESDQGELLDKIVGIVLEEVFKWGPLEVAKYPVGLEQAAEDFPINEILKQSELNQTMIVGIVGMSGAGKSTLAKYLYNLRRPNFNGRSCFLPEVRKKDLPSLQGKLLREVLGYSQDLHIDEGKHILRHCRILLLLDDVDHIDQIDGLLDMDSVGFGSLILITSRDKDLLRRSSPKIVLYDVKPLSRQRARELFCQHAFRQSKPSQELEDLVEEFLEICKGLPLSLKVLGGHLVGFSDREHWKRQLARFSTTLHNDIIKTLKVGYDELDNQEKEAFLDVGCFLMEEETELAIRVLKGLYGSNIVHSLESLHQKCLVDFHYDVQSNDEFEPRKQENPKIGYNDLSLQYRGYKLTMHDQLRELARHIAREKFSVFPNQHNPLRLSSSLDILELRQRWQGESYNIPIWGIRTSKEKPPNFSLQHIRGERVRLVVLELPKEIPLRDFGSWEISGDLVWLRLRNFHFDSMPFLSSTSLESLSVLELEGQAHSIEDFFKVLVQHLIRNNDEPPSRLNEINVNILPTTSSSHIFPTTWSSRWTFDAGHSMKLSENFISSAVQQASVAPIFLLSYLKLNGLKNLCKMALTNITSLQYLRIDSGELPSLRHLDLSGCTNLKELPKSFSKLMQLQHLALRKCKNLSIPLEILGEISTLEYVDLKGCEKLVALPQGIPYQRNLRYLNLLFTRLSELPENLEQLGNLEQLRIGSPELTGLPLSVAVLRGLTELIVIQCHHLQCLSPEGILAPNIKSLTIDCCPIANFTFEKDQGTMGVLRDLTLKNTSMSEICMVEGVYRCLQTIDLSENIELKQVIALPSALVRANLQNCRELKTLKNLSNLVNLRFLNINGCLELKTLSVEGLISLEEIEAQKCWKLEWIEGSSSLKRLKCAKISTDSGIFWEDLCKLSISSCSHQLSNFIFTRKVDCGDMYRFGSNLKYSFYPNTKRMYLNSRVKIEELHSHSAILLCFTSKAVGRRSYCVNFYDRNHLVGKSSDEYITHVGEGGGEPRAHVFMWTQYSKLFKDLKSFSAIDVGCSCDVSAGELEKGAFLFHDGWLVTVNKERDVLKVWEEIITKSAATLDDTSDDAAYDTPDDAYDTSDENEDRLICESYLNTMIP